ncbi:MAG: PKD domain-containing protein [Bacteroidota bacterium]|nr:PKD domain-containing protein [Bacteroidota bacterium]
MTRAKLLTLAVFLTGNIFAAVITQNLKLQVTENSNVTVQQSFALVYAFSANGTDGLDAGDVGNEISLGNPGDNVCPFSLSSNGDIITSIDARPTLGSYKRIQIGFYSKFPAIIKVLASAYGNTPGDSTNRPTYAWIEQISTGYIYYFLGDTVKLDIPANLNFDADFYLHTGPEIVVEKTDEFCFGSNSGDITVHNVGCSRWSLDIYKNAALVFSDSIFQADTTIADLGAGTYTIITSINSIPVDSTVLTMSSEAQIFPDFATDNNTPTTNDVVNFTDYSAVNITPLTYFWTFGDGADDNQTNTSHQYGVAGAYEVVLTLTSISGCQAMVSDSVFVSEGAPEMPLMTQGPSFNQAFYNNDSDNNTPAEYSDFLPGKPRPAVEMFGMDAQRIMITQTEPQLMNITIMNASGQIITTTQTADMSITLDVPATGIYIVRAVNAKKEVQVKTIMVTN